jgi:hypothetical protein
LYASAVTAIGRYSGERNYGLYNLFLASTEILGGSFSGMDGEEAIGITNAHSSTLTASGFVALGHNGSNRNVGLQNSDDGIAMISEAALTGRGGDYAIGVANYYLNSFLQATNITATGQQANNNAYGLSNAYAAETLIDNSTFTAQSSGNDAFGIYNFRSTLAGTHITARGLDAAGGSGEGLHNGDKGNPTLVDISHCVLEGDDYSYNTDTPSVFLNHCRFKGSTQGTGGTTLCMASTQDSTWYENTCP